MPALSLLEARCSAIILNGLGVAKVWPSTAGISIDVIVVAGV